MLSVVSKSILASVLVVGVPVTGIALSSYLKFNTSNTADDEGYTIYATNGENAVTDFENDNNNKYLVQLLGDEQWIECEINIIKTEDKNITTETEDINISDTLQTAHRVLEIKVKGDLDLNWQTNSINVQKKSVETGKTKKAVTLNFLCAKHKGSWIGKTNYFVGTASATKTYSDSSKFTYCQINQSDCKSNAIHDLTTVETANTFGLNLITKNTTPLTNIESTKKYLIEFGKEDKQNIIVNNEIILNDADKSTTSFFSELRPVISLGSDKFFDFVGFELAKSQISEQNEKYVIYATNKEAVVDFVDSSDKKYSCALRGSNLWADCSINVFDDTSSNFIESTTDLASSLGTVNKVFEITVIKNIDLNWQSEKIKIQPKPITDVSSAKEASLTILFSKAGKAQIGKTKHFVGKAKEVVSNIEADSTCNINGIIYSQCNAYTLTEGHGKTDYKFETLTSKDKSTSLEADTHYLIEVGSMDNQKMSIDRTEITFALTSDQKKPTFVEINPVNYDETSKFLASFSLKKDA